jgi:alkyl sulfatase BDS1-like metallo-beta-lactamase superfamily hydrolase
VTINQIQNVYETPEGIARQWFNRGYHGSPEHNSRGVVNRFLGYWDANPATLIPLSPADSAPLYVDMMGGAKKIMKRGRKLADAGDYLLAQEILNKLVQAEPGNQKAKDLLADVYEQIGYQQENPGLRNSYLAGAYELRSGIPTAAGGVDTTSPDIIRAMTTELFLDFLGIRMDPKKAEGMEFTINLATPDNGEKFLIELRTATLTSIEGYQADDADLTLTLDRSDLETVLAGERKLADLIGDGTAKAEGDKSILMKLGSLMVDFDPRFEVLPGTKGAGQVPDLNDYEIGPVNLHAE